MASVRKRGQKWQAQVRRNGHRGIARSFSRRADALAWARAIEAQVDRSDLPPDTRILTRTTLADIVTRYRDTVSTRKRGHETERIVLSAFLRHPICRKSLSQITTEDFASYRDERLRNIKATTLRRQLSPLHNMFEVARDEWQLPVQANPLTKLRLTVLSNRRERRLKVGEIERIEEAAQQCRNQLLFPLVLFALETAMRRGELLSLTWDRVDLDRRALLLPQAKNGFSRIIPLSTRAIAILSSIRKSNERVFPISANAVRLAWGRLTTRAGLNDLHFHDLRHEAISRFFEHGLSVPEVALISGHRDPRMLFRYTHPVRETILAKLP